jgi:hypothetical protein
MNQEQELRAWSLAIAALLKGPYVSGDTASRLQAYKELAGEISAYIRGNDEPLGIPRFNQNPR